MRQGMPLECVFTIKHPATHKDSMWPFSKSLESYLNRTISIRVEGVKFKIKKIDPTNFLDGSRVMMQYYDTYKIEKEQSPEITASVMQKVKDHYRDVFLATIVYPKIKRKESEEGLLVDYLFTDWNFAHDLYSKIMEYTYGKKKLR